MDPDEPEITQPFTVFRDLYNLAHDYMASYVAQGVLPSVKAINRIVLAYLRKENYHTKTWTLLAGAIDEGFNEFVEKSGQIINPNDISIIDPMDNISMEISHFAATLGAYSFTSQASTLVRTKNSIVIPDGLVIFFKWLHLCRRLWIILEITISAKMTL